MYYTVDDLSSEEHSIGVDAKLATRTVYLDVCCSTENIVLLPVNKLYKALEIVCLFVRAFVAVVDVCNMINITAFRCV